MKKKKEQSLVDRVISKVVEKSYIPLHGLIDQGLPFRNQLIDNLVNGETAIASGKQPANFSIQHQGKMDGPYTFELKFEYPPMGKDPEVTAVTLSIGDVSHTENIGSITNLPSFFVLEKRLPVSQKRLQNEKKIGPDSQQGQGL